MEEPRYFYSLDGTDVHGPLELPALQELFAAGTLNAETQLCPEGTEDWHPINLAYFPGAPTEVMAPAATTAAAPAPKLAARTGPMAFEPRASQKLPSKKAAKITAEAKPAAATKAKREEPVRAPATALPVGKPSLQNLIIIGVAGLVVVAGGTYAFLKHRKAAEANNESAQVGAPALNLPAPSAPPAPAPAPRVQDLGIDDAKVQGAVKELQAQLGPQLAAKTKAVDDAAKSCNFDIMSLKGGDDIAARQQAIGKLRDAQNGVASFLQGIDAAGRAALAKDGLKDAEVSAALAGYRKSAQVETLTAFWQAQATLSADHIGRLEFMKQNMSGWMYKGGQLLFANQALLDQYNGLLDSLRGDVKRISELQKQMPQASAGP